MRVQVARSFRRSLSDAFWRNGDLGAVMAETEMLGACRKIALFTRVIREIHA